MKKALVSAMVLGAFAAILVIPGAASATTLCKVKQSPCEAANQYPAETTIVAESSKAVMTGFSAPILSTQLHCESKLKLVSSVSAGVMSLAGQELQWSKCVGAETATTTVLPKFSVGGVAEGNGSLTFTQGLTASFTGVGAHKWPKCEMSIKASQQFSFNGGQVGSAAKVTATEVPTTITGFGCQESSPSLFGADGSTLKGEVTQPYVIKSVNGLTSGNVFLES